jgi:hypothetical protein
VLPLYSLKPNKGANRLAPQELAFVVEGKSLVVSEVSEFAGVRLGAVLKGYAPVGEEASEAKVTAVGFERDLPQHAHVLLLISRSNPATVR